ncbi:carboxymuconolactone decarboxylase family protein [uncultured Tateyamaria sp.]|uniref:carboxymuconolactone decarboxylase family protein n=1 Tax=uncultured Tateyamaria sp. TaxID=455651 RepID=UPI003450BEEC
MLGSAPNGFRLISNSPAALEGYLGLNGALGKGALSAATRERIALAIANHNGCDYCNSAHTYLGKNLVKNGRRRACGKPRRKVDRP